MGGELPAREVARDLHLPVLGIPTSLVARHRQKSQRSSQDIRAWDKFSGKYLPHKSRFRPGNPRLGRFHRISNRDSGNGYYHPRPIHKRGSFHDADNDPARAAYVRRHRDKGCSECPEFLYASPCRPRNSEDRKSVVSGRSVSVRVELGGRRSIKKKKNNTL